MIRIFGVDRRSIACVHSRERRNFLVVLAQTSNPDSINEDELTYCAFRALGSPGDEIDCVKFGDRLSFMEARGHFPTLSKEHYRGF